MPPPAVRRRRVARAASRAVPRAAPRGRRNSRSCSPSAGAADYPRFAAAARQSLGTADAPTDTALALDAALRHVLVDEFQDTSEAQVRAAASADRGLAARRRPHAVPGRRPDAVDLPLPQRRGRAVPRRPRRAASATCALEPLTLARELPLDARRSCEWVNDCFAQRAAAATTTCCAAR
ncbi:MAG: hypothetical protein MZV65_53710 [Chromatiales bacterium]|nr:hypothetical protein [Chromatiales bacterium]